MLQPGKSACGWVTPDTSGPVFLELVYLAKWVESIFNAKYQHNPCSQQVLLGKVEKIFQERVQEGMRPLNVGCEEQNTISHLDSG